MRCNTAKRLIDLQLDNELLQGRVRELELHLKDCADCREFKAQGARLQLLLRHQPRHEFPTWLYHRILDQAASHDRKRLFIKHRRKLQLIPALMALALSIMLGGMIGKFGYNRVNPFPEDKAQALQELPATQIASFGESSLLDETLANGDIQ